MTEKWYVIRTKPNCDGLAASAMERERMKLFFPRVSVPAGEQQRKTVPLFPGYLFIKCDIDSCALPVVSCFPGVLGWVRFNRYAPHVSDEAIIELRDRVETIHGSGGLWQRFKSGQLVRVSQGKLDVIATVLDEPTSPESRVRELLDFMGRQVPATVPWRDIKLPSAASDGGSLPKPNRRTRGRGRRIRDLETSAAAQT
jgi:transcriptional antiterminator RfaH